ncbi:helix-turn-helix transcriptional regulator [Streptomyces sp. NBC_00102]|uniref:helix-turn-helix transcriptional regulator n=1 Tax=Streptomyces sp. NBC_00102 TaxID=2975652 RepID=UPI00224EBCB1|nr:helix-turn-helix transcriptional regulator [Streptomyces sp. NBC_00102]MCX5398690.1 LuxR C-terminal-related transcriptional regulator [Streptomyces sp. NBC_00102]
MSGPYSERPREHRGATELLSAGTARALTGKGGLVLLRGATGTGRTTVLEAAVEAAGGHGMRVLRARCSPGDAWTPFAAVVQLLRSGAGSRESDTAGAVCEGAEPWVAGPDRPGPERAVPGSEGPRTTGDARCAGGADDDAAGERERGDRLRRALLAHTEESPLLVAVDDVHLADAPSYRWLVETARHVDRLRLPVLLAVTERSQYDVDPPAPGFGRGLSPALVRTHTLAPPAADSAAGLVRARFPSATGAWVDACVRAGAASPLLLRALLDDLDASGPPPAVPESAAALYPGAYAAAVSWWLENAGAGTAEVARVLAVLDEEPEREPAGHPEPSGDGRPAERPGRLLAELAGADPARVSGWLTAMTGLGLLRTGTDGRPRYAHPLLRDAVLACVPADQRYAVRAAAAAVTLHRGAPAETVAGHLLLTGPVGEPWAPSVLHGAATAALGAGRTDDAAAYLRRALDEPLPAEHRQRLLTELGSLEYAGSRSSAAIPRFTEALALAGTPRERVSAAVALGTALADRGSTRAALEVLRTADGQLAGHPGLASTLQGATLFLSDHDKTIRREIYQWLRHTADRNPELVSPAAQALLVRYASTAGLISAKEAMRRVRVLLAEPSDPLAEPFLLGAAATVAQWADELDEAQELVSRGLAGQSPHLPHPMHLALLDVRTDIAAARGEFTRLPAGDPVGPDGVTELTPAHAHTLTGLVEAGRTTEARRLANAFDLRELPDSWGRNRLLYARGIQRASDGDPAGALHDFLECGRRQTERQVVSPVVTPWRTAAAQCCLGLGSPGQAIELAEEELRLARVWGTPRPVGRALRILGTVTGGRRGLRLTEEAVELLRTAPATAGTELAGALIAQGRALAATGDHARARTCLREAGERAERLGAARLRDLAERSLRESGARPGPPARTGARSLTASERRIARLAADGRTNTEIADLLHLARRTVETHLTHTYRKLGIRRRVELLASLDAD